MLCALCVGQASALEYTMEAPDDYLFGRPTSDDTIYEWEDPNVDRSKNTALIPPGFGTPTSYLPGSGDPLTPNLIPGALDGGGLVSQTGSVNYPVIDTGNGGSSGQDVGYTAVTSDLYYSGGHLGTLKIPAIGLSTKVYEGTDSSTLAKGAGHFPGTSIWDGNCALVSGTATAALRVTTAGSGMILETCIPWSQAIPLPGPPNWAHAPIRWSV